MNKTKDYLIKIIEGGLMVDFMPERFNESIDSIVRDPDFMGFFCHDANDPQYCGRANRYIILDKVANAFRDDKKPVARMIVD